MTDYQSTADIWPLPDSVNVQDAQDRSDLQAWDNVIAALEAAQSTVRDQQMHNPGQAKMKMNIGYYILDALDDARQYRADAAEEFGLANEGEES